MKTKNKIISLDLDGVVVDTYSFLKERFEDRLGVELSTGVVGALLEKRVEKYLKGRGLDPKPYVDFFNSYQKLLFENLGNLAPVKGAQEYLERLKTEARSHEVSIIINSYRPSSFEGANCDIKQITSDWLRKNDIDLPFVLHPEKKSKFEQILKNPRIIMHVDDEEQIAFSAVQAARWKEYGNRYIMGIWYQHPVVPGNKRFGKTPWECDMPFPIPLDGLYYQVESWQEVYAVARRESEFLRRGGVDAKEFSKRSRDKPRIKSLV